ncbi:UBN2_2 domain-containing protein [Cephalotus follicularis]|uniref:UBN2_2 domain-containing protein n=1 Tax=Cephalotus follicularis TaxID=3775 RepID=A0A1Q3CII8_CEPFO|nr:UBN2_2 domain-containing protein [Cephalotus follicularis]
MFNTAKKIWDNLGAQFRKEEELSKSHMVDKFLDFKFCEDMEITPQVTDLENLRTKMNNENISVTDIFLVGAIIYKLPAARHSFKTEMYRKKEQMRLDKLNRYLRIEDENLARHNLELIKQQQFVANAVTSPRNFLSSPSHLRVNLRSWRPRKLSIKRKRKLSATTVENGVIGQQIVGYLRSLVLTHHRRKLTC